MASMLQNAGQSDAVALVSMLLPSFSRLFPYDIIHLILWSCTIDTLKNAVLVCRDWHESARHKLLRACCMIPGRIGKDLGWDESRMVLEAIEFLEGAGKHVVRDLYLLFWLIEHPSTIALVPRLLGAVAACSQLKLLVIQGGNVLNRTMSNVLCSLDTLPPSLQWYISDLSGDDAPFFTQLHRLRALRLEGSPPPTLESSIASGFSLPRLESLQVESAAQLRYMTGAPVEDLSFPVTHSDSPQAVLSNLRRASVPLRTLHLKIRGGSTDWYREMTSQLADLKCLWIEEGKDYLGSDHHQVEWQALAELSQLQALFLASSIPYAGEGDPDWDLTGLQKCRLLSSVVIARPIFRQPDRTDYVYLFRVYQRTHTGAEDTFSCTQSITIPQTHINHRHFFMPVAHLFG